MRRARAALLCALGCGHHAPAPPAEVDAAAPQLTSLATPNHAPPFVGIDPILHPEQCTFSYRGVVLDLGDVSTHARYGTWPRSSKIEIIEREGATWARLRDRTVALSFFMRPDDVGPADGAASEAAPFVQARIRGGAAKSVSMFLDGKLLGAAALTKGEGRVVAVKSPHAALTDGEHELVMRFMGGAHVTSEELAEVDWVHVGVGEPDERYAAPTRADSLVSATFAGQPMRALSLRAPGFARCEGWIAAGTAVEASIAIAGGGEGDAEVRIVRDRAPPAVLGTVHVTAAEAGERHRWPVGDLGAAGIPGALELVSLRASKGARVVFGEPRVVGSGGAAAQGEPASPTARGLVLVVLGELATRSLGVYGGARPTPELAALAAAGVTFEAHRATTGLAAGALGSMLTGLRARSLALDEANGRLPRGLTTVAEAARQAGVSTAMFTANPTTGAAFGFDRGWSTFAARSPTEDAPATKVFDDAAQWIDAHSGERFLVLVHARGGHPPWEATAEELKSLDPPNYGGGVDPKHAAELLAHARRSPGFIRYGDADRARAWALYALAVGAHDTALGRLVTAIRAAGREADTTLIVTGDVGLNDTAHIPFAEADSLEETALSIPLVIRPAGSTFAGKRVSAPTSGDDVARTVLDALGLSPPEAFGGLDLLDVAVGRASSEPRPMMATLGERFALRWGTFVLSGQKRHEAKFCDLTLEPACLTDVRSSYPLAVDLLHAATLDALTGEPAPPPREPATLDPVTSAALRAWGR